MRKIIILVILFLTIKPSFLLTSEYQYIGNIKSYTQKHNIIKLECDNAKVEITILTDGLFRIKMYPGKIFPQTNPYAVLPLVKLPTIHPSWETRGFLQTAQRSPIRVQTMLRDIQIPTTSTA